jgi:ribonuclease BN (tRNA processing enzyme)
MASSELVSALVDRLAIDAAALLDVEIPELRASSVEILEGLPPYDRASPGERLAQRTAQWNVHLERSREIVLDDIPVLGAPPPRDVAEAWLGRQIAALDVSGATLALGECRGVDERSIRMVAPEFPAEETKALLVRDAWRDQGGDLRTAPRLPRSGYRDGAVSSVPDLDGGTHDAPPLPRITSLVTAKALLVNGIFGDPLLHVRLRHQKRSFLFDLGEATRLQARIAHQVTDIFLSHAHIDHIGGFLGLLRSCIGDPRPRRVYGPPGIADHLAGMIAGIRWDRVGDRGPVFEVSELYSDRLERHLLRAGEPARERLEDRNVTDGVLLQEPGLEIRAVELDHGIPVLAFAFVEGRVLHIRKERLQRSGLDPGAWLSELKRVVLDEKLDHVISLPGGRQRSARELAADLLLSRTGKKLVYATDLDDNETNRERLARFAEGASFFYCEASFQEKDVHLARATQHLTTRATAEIAKSAQVEMLVPFHFSKRYESSAEEHYAEIESFFPGRVLRLATRRLDSPSAFT